jgi:hypothetical protein
MIFYNIILSVACLRGLIYILDIPVLMRPVCWSGEYLTLELSEDDTNVSKYVGVFVI